VVSHNAKKTPFGRGRESIIMTVVLIRRTSAVARIAEKNIGWINTTLPPPNACLRAGRRESNRPKRMAMVAI
jgi:hypothetical protein